MAQAGSGRTAGRLGAAAGAGRTVAVPHRIRVRRVVPVVSSGRRAASLRRFGRYAVWAVPAYAILAGLGALRRDPAFATDPGAYQRYLDHGRYAPAHLIYTDLAALVGLVALVGVAALLTGVRGHRVAVAGLVLGLAGAALLLPQVGTLVVHQEAARSALLHGHLSRVAFNAQHAGGTGAALAVTGALALTCAWVLAGVAVWRSQALQRADGVLVMISAPLVYLGGMVLAMLPVLGALLLLAAGIGLSWTAARLAPATRTP